MLVAGEVDLTELTAVIVACFVSNNILAPADVPNLISNTHTALLAIDSRRCKSGESRTPSVSIEESITKDYLICLDDGRKLRSLKRYLRRKYSLSPEEYRMRWNLPADYPMVAPGYAELRSKIAKQGNAQAPGSSPRSNKPPARRL
jgi:predicted transcriptional regulator